MKYWPFIILYAVLVSAGVLTYSLPKGPLPVLLLALIAFLLYTLTLFLVVEARVKPGNFQSFLTFLRHRRWALTLFLFALLILSLLIITTR